MEGFNFAPPDQKRRGKKITRGKQEEVRDERTIVVHTNGKPQGNDASAVIDLHYLTDYTTSGLKNIVGKKLFGGTPAAGFYHDDGIPVSNMALLKHGEVIFATVAPLEPFIGSKSTARTPTKGTPTVADIEKEQAARREAATQNILISTDDFVPCATFIGIKKNYYFGTSDKGLGYHRDFWRQEEAASTKRTDLSDLLSIYGGEDCLKSADTLLHSSAAPVEFVDRAGVPILEPSEEQRSVPVKPDVEQLKAQRSRSNTPPPDVLIKRSKISSSPSPPPERVQKPSTPPPPPKTPPPVAPQGLAEKEAEAEQVPKKEKMSKRARRRAKNRSAMSCTADDT